LKQDGHIHSPYCPHGTSDSFELYIEKAIVNGFTDITFTEHAPAPNGFIDTVPNQDSFMKSEHLESYIIELQKLKIKYARLINIRIGLEVDFIEGYEKETKNLLDQIFIGIILLLIKPEVKKDKQIFLIILLNQIMIFIKYQKNILIIYSKTSVIL